MHKNTKLKLSLASSFISKVLTLSLQVIAMPIVVMQLGQDGFVLYAMLLSISSWLLLSTAGLSPAVMVKLSGLHSKEKKRSWIASGYSLFFSIGFLVSTFSVFFSVFFDLGVLFGYEASPFTSDIQLALIVISIGFFLQCLSIVSDAIILSEQKQYVTNLAISCSALFSLTFLFLFNEQLTSPSDFILVVFMPSITLRFILGSIFLIKNKLLCITQSKTIKVKILLRSGLRFFKAGSLTNFFLHVLPIVVIGNAYSQSTSSQYVSVNSLIVLASGLVSMLCLPLIPAIRNSIVEKDTQWLNTAISRLRKYCLLIITVSVVVGWSIASYILTMLFDKNIEYDYYFIGIASVYFSTLVWSNYSYCILSALGKINYLSRVFLAKAAFSIFTIFIFTLLNVEVNPFLIFIFYFSLFEFLQVKRYIKTTLHEKNININ